MDNTRTYQYNSFIFNWVKNYDKQTEQLKESMEEFNNNVKVFHHLTYKELATVVDMLRKVNFYLYDYISIIILDNKSKNEHFIETSDGIEVLLYSEILTLIQTNKTLKNKRRLFVIQKLIDFKDFDDNDDDDDDVESKKVLIRSCRFSSQPCYKNLKILYQGLTVAIKAKEFSNDFENSAFIDTFCNEFKSNADMRPIDEIYNRIMQNIKINCNPKMIDISFETNQTPKDSLIFGSALNSDELRDFEEI